MAGRAAVRSHGWYQIGEDQARCWIVVGLPVACVSSSLIPKIVLHVRMAATALFPGKGLSVAQVGMVGDRQHVYARARDFSR